LSSIEDRGQTDRVTALPHSYTLDIDLWPWYVTLTSTLTLRLWSYDHMALYKCVYYYYILLSQASCGQDPHIGKLSKVIRLETGRKDVTY